MNPFDIYSYRDIPQKFPPFVYLDLAVRYLVVWRNFDSDHISRRVVPLLQPGIVRLFSLEGDSSSAFHPVTEEHTLCAHHTGHSMYLVQITCRSFFLFSRSLD